MYLACCFLQEYSYSKLKVRLNRLKKRAGCFAALLQNELNSDVVRFATYVQINVLQQLTLLPVAESCCRSTCNEQNRFFTRFAAMFRNKLYVFVALLNRSFLK